MSDTVDAAVKALAARLDGQGIDGSVKFVITGEGAIRIDEGGVSSDGTADESGAAPGAAAGADCTITADSETFHDLLAGDLDPTAAFMSGRLAIEGDMGLAMRLASLFG